MPHPDRDNLVARLERPVAEELQKGLDTPLEKSGFRSNHFARACALAGLAGDKPWPRTVTPEQRPLAEILAYEDEYAGYGCAMPRSGRARRRFLGLEPPSILEAGDPPLWHVLQSAPSPDAALAIVSSLSVRDRVAFCLASPFDYGVPERVVDGAVPTDAELDALGDALPGLADEAAAVRGVVVQGGISDSLRGGLFLALARRGTPILPGWDVLFPRRRSATIDAVRQAADALDEPRRTQAIVGALHKDVGADEAALALVETHPSEALARFVLSEECMGRVPKKVRVDRLRALADASPQVAEAVHAALPRGKRVATLRADAVIVPTSFADLTAVQAAQLRVAAGPLYDAPPDSPRGWFVSFVSLVDARGRPTWDVLRMMVDSGAVFRPGTTEVVATLIQGSVESDDRALVEAVEAALFGLGREAQKKSPRPKAGSRASKR